MHYYCDAVRDFAIGLVRVLDAPGIAEQTLARAYDEALSPPI